MQTTSNETDPVSPDDLRAAFASLSTRLLIVEQRLGIQSGAQPGQPAPVVPLQGPPPAAQVPGQRESLEFELGQNWFALIGIGVLAIGMGFLLSLPYAGLPPYLPALGGYLLSAVVLLLARLAGKSFDAVSRYLRGSGMLLLFYSTLRLFYFGPEPAMDPGSWAGQGLFFIVLVFNLVLAWRRQSAPLFILAILTGFASALAVGSTTFLLLASSLLVLLAACAQVRLDWRMMVPVVFSLAMVTYLVWAIGNPAIGNPLQVRSGPVWPVLFIPVWIILFSIVLMARRNPEVEDAPVQVAGLLLCGLGFGVFFLHNLLAFEASFLVNHLLISAVFLVLAVVFWVREESWFSTFLYAMTGYAALSFALVKAFAVPEVFVALSLQSLVVIATAIYFRSRFIIVANGLIFAGIILGYMMLAETEQGMSIGFGIVALVSARILNWQKDRLALKTDLMRICYLGIAFLVFPYALYYWVPETFVAVAWAGLALFYYGMNLVMRNRRYRWMGHLTLLLTALYVVVVGTRQLESHYRILSFLILGTIMLVVSLAFTMARAKRRQREPVRGGE